MDDLNEPEERADKEDVPNEPTSWQRFGQWCKTHEDELLRGAIFGVVIGVSAGIAAQKIDGKTVIGGSILTRDDGASVIVVRLKNGSRKMLIRSVAEIKVGDVHGVGYEK